LTEFQDVKDEAFTFFDAKELHEYTTIIQSILDELGKRNPFQELINRQSELADAEREFADAKKQLDAVNNGGKIITGVKNTSLEDGVIKAEYTYLSASEALEKYRKAKEKVVSANAVFLNAEKNAKEKVDELAKVLQSLGNAIGGVAGNILSLMGDITLFVTSSIESMDKMTKVGVQSMSAIEKASIILGIISAAIQVFTKIGNVIGDSYNQYEKYAEKISKINELTEAVNNYKIAALEAKQAEDSWFSENNLKNLRDFREVHTEVDEAYQSKLNEEQATYQNEEGTGWLKKIWKPITWVIDNTYGKLYGFNINKQYEEGTSSAKDNLRIETRKATKGFLGTGLGAKSQKTENLTDWAKKNGYGELFDDKGYINKTAAKEILDKYGDKLVGETKETLETLLELKEKYDEYLTQLHEYVDSLYAPLVDNFVDAIFDWLDTGKDALDSFKDYAGNTFRKIAMDMIKSMALDMVFGKGEKSFQNKVSHLYELYAEGELDELELYNRVATETSALGAKMQDSIPFLENILEVMADSLYGSTGIDIRNGDSSSSQSPISVGFQTMSQDTADELNGRFTVLQMIGEEMRMLFLQQSPLVAQMSLDMDVIKLYTQTISTDVTEMKDIALTSMNHLSAIEKNTKHLQFMREDLSKIKEKVNNL
jgi:phage tail tape measure protein